MITRLAVICVIALAAGCERAHTAESQPPSRMRVQSTDGFSFLPPHGGDWTEEFDRCQISYSKRTDPSKVSFYALAGNCKLDSPLREPEDVVEFVRKRKDEWGTDGRFTDIETSFIPEAANPLCVRYRMDVHDNGANNKGDHPYLIVKVVGRFCKSRHDPKAIVDLSYSVRHVPGYDDSAYRAEGEAFLDSLRIETPIDRPSAAAPHGKAR